MLEQRKRRGTNQVLSKKNSKGPRELFSRAAICYYYLLLLLLLLLILLLLLLLLLSLRPHVPIGMHHRSRMDRKRRTVMINRTRIIHCISDNWNSERRVSSDHGNSRSKVAAVPINSMMSNINKNFELQHTLKYGLASTVF